MVVVRVPGPKPIRFTRSAVSPVIATILMVAVTVVLSAVMLALVLNMVDTGDAANDGEVSPLPRGSGTVEDPYLIRSLGDIMTMMDERDANYALASNVDASATRFMNDGAGFQPMFPLGNTFQGSFDGRTFVISGLYINRPGTNQVGLFSWIAEGAVVKNVTLVNAEIIGQDRVGGIAGRSTGVIENCHVSGTINGRGEVGGIIGANWRIVSNSSSSASVTATGNDVGGLVGLARKGPSNGIHNCYATGTVSGANNVGGLVGAHGTAGSGTTVVTNCFSTGTVFGTTAGGLIGFNEASGATVTASFWDTTTSGRPTSAAGTGLATAAMKNPSTYTNAGWSSGIWSLQSGQYPELLSK